MVGRIEVGAGCMKEESSIEKAGESISKRFFDGTVTSSLVHFQTWKEMSGFTFKDALF